MTSKEIHTRSVVKGVAKTTPILLSETPETKVGFYPILNPKGVSGELIKFKRSRSAKWGDVKVSDFKDHALSPMEKITIPLSTEALQKLLDEVTVREGIAKDGVKYGKHEYITVEKDRVVILTSKNKKDILEQILTKGYSDDFWSLISGSEPELADKLSSAHLQIRRKETVAELKERLKSKYPETSGKDSWQAWIFANNWLFGSNYLEPIEKQKINISGIMPDYLFPTVDGFVDVLEIKLPEDEVILTDTDHKGSWKWTSETNSAIGQVVNYLSEIDRLRLEIERSIQENCGRRLSLLKPRAYILIGNSKEWTSPKNEGLRKLNHSLHGIEVITYNGLLQRGCMFVDNPTGGVLEASDEIVVPS